MSLVGDWAWLVATLPVAVVLSGACLKRKEKRARLVKRKKAAPAAVLKAETEEAGADDATQSSKMASHSHSQAHPSAHSKSRHAKDASFKSFNTAPQESASLFNKGPGAQAPLPPPDEWEWVKEVAEVEVDCCGRERTDRAPVRASNYAGGRVNTLNLPDADLSKAHKP